MTATIVDLDATLPAVEPEPEPLWGPVNQSWAEDFSDDAMVREVIDIERDRIKRQMKFLRGRKNRAWYMARLSVLSTRLASARRAADPEASLQAYLDELTYLQAEVRQVLETVHEYVG